MGTRKYIEVDGTTYTDYDVERFADEAEPEEGYTGGHVGPAKLGRPVSEGSGCTP